MGWERRSVLAGLAGLTGAGTIALAGDGDAPVLAASFRRAGEAADTGAIERALATGKPVRLQAGAGSGSGGAYLVESVRLPAGATLIGDGPASVVRTISPASRFAFIADSGSPTATIADITLRRFAIEGHVRESGFREHWNLVNVAGVERFTVEDVLFRGFAGDGICIAGAVFIAGGILVGRRNRGVRLLQCTFDGLTGDNRNAISITGGTDMRIERCHFVRCSRPTMPGPIDFEPDSASLGGLEGLRVVDCSFDGCGGNVGQISIVAPPDMARLPHNILIAGNNFRKYRGSGSDVCVIIGRPATSATMSMDCVIRDNVGVDGGAGVRLYSGCGIEVRDNSWTNYGGRGFIGYAEPRYGCRDISMSDRFDNCGGQDGVALGLYKGDNVRLVGNVFRGCGGPVGPGGSACVYLGPGYSRGLIVRDNDFIGNPRARHAIERDASHVTDLKRGALVANRFPVGGAIAL